MRKLNQLYLAVILAISLIGFSKKSSATTYTASVNGNWSAAATWGGTGPGATISNGDAVVIPLGTTVTLDENVTINGTLSSVAVAGSLNGSGTNGLTITAGTLSGSGSVAIDNISVGAAGYITSTGSISVNAFTNSQTLLDIAAGVSVGNSVTFSAGVIQLDLGSSITLANNITLNMSGGSLAINGGAVTMSGNYNLVYSGSASAIGLEAAASGLQNMTINLASSGSQITLANPSLTIGGALTLQSGQLVLNGNNLTINGTVSSSAGGSVYSSSLSDISINGSGNVGTIAFSSGWNTVGNLTVNVGSGGSVSLGSDVNVSGALALNGGSLNINGHNLTLGGTASVSGSGSISGSSSSNITINGSGNVGTLTFTSGSNTLGNVTVNIGSGGSVSLGSDLIVSGALALSGGTLNLNAHNLTISGTVSSTGGSVYSSSSSNVTINGSGSIGTLAFSSGWNTVNNLSVNVSGSGGSISLGSDLTVSGALTLSGGSLSINGHNLALNGTISTSGSGSISGSSSSNLTLSGSGSMGSLSFSSGGAMLNNLTVNISSAGSASLATDLSVGGMLSLTSGTLNIGSDTLTVSGSGSVQGGSAASYVIASDVGRLAMTVANAGGSAMFQIGTTANYAPVMITNNSSASGSFYANAHAGVFADGTTGADISATQSVVNTSWDVESSIASGANVNLQMYWNTNMQVNGFDNTQAYISHYTNGAWNTSALAAATAQGGGTYSLALDGVTSFSPFAVFDRNTSTGINDVAVNKALNIYPNPARDVVYLSSPDPNSSYGIAVYNMNGQLMYEGQTKNNALDVSFLASGVYNIAIFQQGTSYRSKVAIIR